MVWVAKRIVTYHSRCHRNFNLFFARIGCDGNDRHVSGECSLTLQLPDPSRAREPVHHRHFKVHQYHIQTLAASIAFPEI